MILEVQGLSKAFGALSAVDNVDLAYKEGGLTSIIGPNGAGKTTLFNLLTGHAKADSGRIIFRGEDITNLPPYEVCRRGLVKSFQISSIFPRLSVVENVQIAMQAKRRKSLNFFSLARNMFRKEALVILEEVGLREDVYKPSGLMSHGNIKLLELALGLASEPYFLLLDEPTAGMSPEETTTVVKLIRRINQERGLSIIFIEHDMDVVLSISQRIKVMARGKIIAQGSPEEVSKNEEVRRVYLGE